MVVIERALRNYLVNPNDLDLGFAMARLAELAKECCRERGCSAKRTTEVLVKTFFNDLKIGNWPSVLEGTFEPNFKDKMDIILKKKNGDVHKVAELMVKQCLDTVKRNMGVGERHPHL